MINIAILGIGPSYGGISSVLLNALKNFDRQEIAATVILYNKSILEDEIKELGYSIEYITPFGVNRKKFHKDMEELLKKNNFDFIWVNKSSKVNVDVFRLAKKYGVKTIAHSHGSSLECSSKIRFIAIKLIELFTSPIFYKNVDIPIACSESASEYLFSRKYRNKHHVNILLNTIDINSFKFSESQRASVREELKIQENEKVLIAVGRLVNIKNPFFMLRLIEKLPNDYKLVIVGQGELRNKIDEEIVKRKLSHRVVMLGARRDVNTLLNGADIFILPSFHEGFPVSAIEAQANGLQCVVSDSITDEVVALENCKKADIDKIENWVATILDFSKSTQFDRCGCADKMEQLGFDNKVYSKKFVEILKKNL